MQPGYISGLEVMLAVVLISGFISPAAHADVEIGRPAPEFELYDQHLQRHHTRDYAGKWVILYFYPKNDTPGCTIEACKFRDDLYRIRALDAEVVGISLDSPESHARFAYDYGLPFTLLSDPEGVVAAAYGSLFELGPVKFARRNTFIIDRQGNVAGIYRSVDPRHHSEQIISDLQALQSK